MQHATRVHRGEPGADTANDVDRRVLGKRPTRCQVCPQIDTVDVFHRQEQMSLDVTDVVHATDVRMRYLARDADLVVKLAEAPRIGRERTREELQRDRMTQPKILGEIDDAHPAPSELADDPIASAQLDASGHRCLEEVRGGRSRDPDERPGAAEGLDRSHCFVRVGQGKTCGLEVDERPAAEWTEAASLWRLRIAGRTAHARIIDGRREPRN